MSSNIPKCPTCKGNGEDPTTPEYMDPEACEMCHGSGYRCRCCHPLD